MNRVLVVALLATYLVFGAGSARAHFQLLYPGESARMTGGNLDLLMVFTHPFYGEPNMIMEPPQALYFIRQRGNDGKPEKVDLLPLAKKFDWIVSGRDPREIHEFGPGTALHFQRCQRDCKGVRG